MQQQPRPAPKKSRQDHTAQNEVIYRVDRAYRCAYERGHNNKSRRTRLMEGYDRFINATIDESLSVTLVTEKRRYCEGNQPEAASAR
jgi:hypothetical protein